MSFYGTPRQVKKIHDEKPKGEKATQRIIRQTESCKIRTRRVGRRLWSSRGNFDRLEQGHGSYIIYVYAGTVQACLVCARRFN